MKTRHLCLLGVTLFTFALVGGKLSLAQSPTPTPQTHNWGTINHSQYPCNGALWNGCAGCVSDPNENPCRKVIQYFPVQVGKGCADCDSDEHYHSSTWRERDNICDSVCADTWNDAKGEWEDSCYSTDCVVFEEGSFQTGRPCLPFVASTTAPITPSPTSP